MRSMRSYERKVLFELIEKEFASIVKCRLFHAFPLIIFVTVGPRPLGYIGARGVKNFPREVRERDSVNRD